MWERLATSELLSTFFPTWLRRGNGYWLNRKAHPVLSSYYPPNVFSGYLSKYLNLDDSFVLLLCVMFSHVIFGFISWYWLFSQSYEPLLSLFGALTLTFGAYSLKQQPCIIYTLSWFPLTLHQNPIISSIAIGMMILSGYYPLELYLLPISLMAHLLWYKEVWLISGILIGLPQLIPFLKYLPKTTKRMRDKCESPEVERRFYVGIIPVLLVYFGTVSGTRVWPILIAACLGVLGIGKEFLPRVHERLLIVVQFCMGWMAVSGLNYLNLNPTNLVIIVLLHAFDLYWHNKECLPPRPWCELYQKPSWAFNTRLTRYLEANLDGNRVAGLPWPLFTGLVNGFKTMGYQGSMQLKLMARWRGTSGSHGIEGLSEDDLERYRVRFSYGSKRDGWESTPIHNLWRNPRV